MSVWDGADGLGGLGVFYFGLEERILKKFSP